MTYEFAPPAEDERSSLLAYLEIQRRALRATLEGLTEQQARQRTTASELTLAGLVQHTALVEWGWTTSGIGGRPMDEVAPENPQDSFHVAPETTIDSLLAKYTAIAADTERLVNDVDDLSSPLAIPEAKQWSVRWCLLHVIEETARHAGHADIIRESLDGAKATELTLD